MVNQLSEQDYVLSKAMVVNKKLPEYKIIRGRRRSVVIAINDDGSLEVRCPYSFTKPHIDKIIEDRLDWIYQKQSCLSSRISLPDVEKISKYEYKKLSEQLMLRIDNYMIDYNGPIPARFVIKRQKTRWGSCSSKRNININLKALYLPDELFIYLLEHELAHLQHMNHSADFWNYLTKRLPEAKSLQRKLKLYKLS